MDNTLPLISELIGLAIVVASTTAQTLAAL